MDEYVDIHSATIVCGECGFIVRIDGGASEDEVRELCVRVTQLHGRQRHNDTTQFQTTFEAHTAPGRPDRIN